MRIELGKKYQTRDGRPVRIFSTNLGLKDYPVIGAITEADGSEEPCEWMADGQALDSDSWLDLVSIYVPAMHDLWFTFNSTFVIEKHCFNSQQAAQVNAVATDGHVAHVIWED